MQPSGGRPLVISFRIEHMIGWGITAVLCLIPVWLWVQVNPLGEITTWPQLLLALGKVTGLVGTVMYALNLVYSTRLRFLEYLFGGLNRVYIAHHILGGLALVMLAFHPFLLALRFVGISLREAALLLLPNGLGPLQALFNTKAELHADVLQQWAIFFGIIAFWGMVGLLLVTFYVRLPYRIWLFSHKFLGVAFFIAGLHVLFISSDTSRVAALKYYMLTIIAIGIAAFVYRTLMAKIFIRHFSYRVDQVYVEGGNVTHILMSPSNEVMPYKPGQFVFVRFKGQGISGEWHPFSISSAPHELQLRLSVKGLGDYTNRLSVVQPGSIAEIEGAYGRFSYTNFKNRKQIWIAGGIGVTPFISMARSLPPQSYQIDLYYAVKTASEIVDWKALYDITVVQQGTFRVIPYIADQQPGRLNADYIEHFSGSLRDKDIYICGPPAMMKSLRKQLRNKGVPGTSIYSEEFAMT